MTRPTIDQFFPSDTTPGDIQKAFIANPELYKYITAMDAYIDWMEEKHDDMILSEVIAFGKDKTDEELGITRFKTDMGGILIKRSRFIDYNEIGLID